MAEKLLSVVEAAEKLDITPSYVRRLIRAGRMGARRVGRAWVINESALSSYKRGIGGRPRFRDLLREAGQEG